MKSKQEKIFSSKTLTYFLQLTKTMNYTQAAQILGITQPALTQQIKKLERAVGAPLFYSVGKKLKLSDAGYIMVNATNQINDVLNSATNKIQRSTSATNGEIHIGMLASIESGVFEDFIGHYYEKEPNVKIVLHMLTRREIWERLENNQIDLAVMYLPDASIKNWRPYESTKIITDDLLYIHHDDALAKQKRVKLAKAADSDWVTYPEGYYIESVISETFKNALIDQPRSVASFTTPDQIRHFVETTQISTALPSSYVLSHNDLKGSYVAKFEPAIKIDLSFVFRRDKDAIPRIQNFLTEFNNFLEVSDYMERLKKYNK